jgi:hypothetical protein
MTDLRDFSEEELRKELESRSAIWLVVDLVHTHFCMMDHNNQCTFYNERQVIDTNLQPSHQHWYHETQKRMELYGLSSKQLLQAFNQCAKALEVYSKLAPEHKQLFADIIDINF